VFTQISQRLWKNTGRRSYDCIKNLVLTLKVLGGMLNTKNSVICILIGYMVVCAATGYAIQAKNPRPTFKVSVNSSNADLKLIKEVSNLDCREYESAAMQNGCIIMRTKVLTILGVTPPKFKPTLSLGVNTPKQICFADKGVGYLEFNPNKTYFIRGNSTETPFKRFFEGNITLNIMNNASVYNLSAYRSVRVYV
jgi:hypothetical protein